MGKFISGLMLGGIVGFLFTIIIIGEEEDA